MKQIIGDGGPNLMGQGQRLSPVPRDDVFQVTPGSLFPSLQRLEGNGWASGEWGVSESNRKAKYYSITTGGRKQLKTEEKRWQSITLAASKVLEGA